MDRSGCARSRGVDVCDARGKAIGGGKSSIVRSVTFLSRHSSVGFSGVVRGYGTGVERATERERAIRGRNGTEQKANIKH